MPPPLDEHTGWYAAAITGLSGLAVVVVRWLFNTRRDLRSDHSETSAETVYRSTIKHQQERIEYLESLLAKRDLRVNDLEERLLSAQMRIQELLTYKGNV